MFSKFFSSCCSCGKTEEGERDQSTTSAEISPTTTETTPLFENINRYDEPLSNDSLLISH